MSNYLKESLRSLWICQSSHGFTQELRTVEREAKAALNVAAKKDIRKTRWKKRRKIQNVRQT